MKIQEGKYRIELIDESNYSEGSADNLFVYEQQYVNEDGFQFTTHIGIKLYHNDKLHKSVIVRSTGGASGIHETSQIIKNNSLAICCAESVFNLSIPDLKLNWLTKADWATCFQIFEHEEDYIIHGELSITRISENGEVLWQNSGADIFTSLDGKDAFKLDKNSIEVKDWNNKIYKFDLDGNTIN